VTRWVLLATRADLVPICVLELLLGGGSSFSAGGPGKDPLGVAHKHEDEDGGDKPQVGHRQQLPLGDDSQRDVDVRLSAPPIIMT
jgi:hypothetical protein